MRRETTVVIAVPRAKSTKQKLQLAGGDSGGSGRLVQEECLARERGGGLGEVEVE